MAEVPYCNQTSSGPVEKSLILPPVLSLKVNDHVDTCLCHNHFSFFFSLQQNVLCDASQEVAVVLPLEELL